GRHDLAGGGPGVRAQPVRRARDQARVRLDLGRGSVRRVVDGAGVPNADGEAETVDRGVVAHRTQAVHGHRRDVHEVALDDLALFALDDHDPPARRDVIELMGRVVVRVDLAAARHLELAHQLEETAVGDLLHLPRPHQPPHGHGAVVLDLGLDLFDRPHVHRHKDAERIATVSSISTAAPRGSAATPMAERVWRPASPNTSCSTRLAPSTTAGWASKPGAEATNPVTRTTRTTRSRLPSASRSTARALRAQTRAASWPPSTLTPAPSTPRHVSFPSRRGNWPEVKARSPWTTTASRGACGNVGSGSTIPSSAKRASTRSGTMRA